MAQWSQLPPELLNLISKRLDSETDLLRFRSVCSQWRSTLPAQSTHPTPSCFPILPNDDISDTNRGFYLSKRTIFRLGLPEPSCQTPPSDTWLIKLEQDGRQRMHLLDPLSRFEFKPMPTNFPRILDPSKFRVSELGHEFVLRPFASSIGDAGNLQMGKVAFHSRVDGFVLLAMHDSGKLVLFKSGDTKWTVIGDLTSPYDDVILFEGQFYAVDNMGMTVVFYIDSSPCVSLAANPFFGGDKKLLVESCGDLLLVDMYLSLGPEDYFGYSGVFEGCYLIERTAVRFEVFKLDREEQMWVELKSLGDQMVFLEDNCTFSASASDFPGCVRNCIFFTDNFFFSGRAENVMKNCGISVFNLESGSIVPFARCTGFSKLFWPPPEWVSSTMLAVE
ncbi:F-box protein SKIP23-like [Cornus florida]|uniref:F-box protein SKIP23-like n=1 Tax=Cornus florida TaxID=4283 RepID=UPI00289F383A|nr:F-box protein SKIP23-like [Cornus florida]XP_059653905.1 F-box protein SKIP23-like [Cornus florida]XP_059653906.1 F-box protein SKIP23-like [Cornus florida]XP_059653907.1 F-box protein SKIP23-like [Cornus florida]XP_059653909.1 F-box protein SKIP23-like [Cornus florida]XP_059653910.1 F-box protein SKIP23-like [Cornus florida]XP_059653911.1 F-box protein SKIP23-like [Cornus florida]XP_059653912.1 F-box protein SKIP23-like [Cornus florida]